MSVPSKVFVKSGEGDKKSEDKETIFVYYCICGQLILISGTMFAPLLRLPLKIMMNLNKHQSHEDTHLTAVFLLIKLKDFRCKCEQVARAKDRQGAHAGCGN